MSIIRDANNWFNNVFLTEMAMPKKEVMNKIATFSDSIIEHIIKCVVYGDSTKDFSHWITEISNFLSIINDYKVKSGSGKLKYEEYLKRVFYDRQGDEEQDMRQNLRVFKLDKSYPDFDITSSMISQLWRVFSRIAEECSTIFADKNNTFKAADFRNLILDIFEQNGVNP